MRAVSVRITTTESEGLKRCGQRARRRSAAADDAHLARTFSRNPCFNFKAPSAGCRHRKPPYGFRILNSNAIIVGFRFAPLLNMRQPNSAHKKKSDPLNHQTRQDQSRRKSAIIVGLGRTGLVADEQQQQKRYTDGRLFGDFRNSCRNLSRKSWRNSKNNSERNLVEASGGIQE